MSSTNFPNGLSTTTAVHTINSHIVTNTISVASTFTASGPFSIASASQIVGQTYYIPVVFGTASALEQKSVIPGFANCSLDAVYQTVSAVSALVANYTVQVGSAGAVAVATVANTTQSVGVVNSLTTTAVTFDGTASGIVCIRSAQGTAGETSLTLVVRRTA